MVFTGKKKIKEKKNRFIRTRQSGKYFRKEKMELRSADE